MSRSKECAASCRARGSRDHPQSEKSSWRRPPWRFAKLSHNRRYLHYADFEQQMAQDPGLDSLTEKVDLSIISSVVSNVSAPSDDSKSTASVSTVQNLANNPKATTKITIYSYASAAEAAKGETTKELPILTLWPVSHSLASEWLDGLLLLLNQAPITAETSKLIGLVSDYGLKIRLLNGGSTRRLRDHRRELAWCRAETGWTRIISLRYRRASRVGFAVQLHPFLFALACTVLCIYKYPIPPPAVFSPLCPEG